MLMHFREKSQFFVKSDIQHVLARSQTFSIFIAIFIIKASIKCHIVVVCPGGAV